MVVEDIQTVQEEGNGAADTDPSMVSLVLVDGIHHHANFQWEDQTLGPLLEIPDQGQENAEVLLVVFVVWVEVEIFQSDSGQESMAAFCYLFEMKYSSDQYITGTVHLQKLEADSLAKPD